LKFVFPLYRIADPKSARKYGGEMVLRIGRAVRALAALATLILLCSSTAGAGAAEFKVPVEYYKLPNGLRVVLSPDHTSPTICVGVYYRIGFRVEPRDRTGFAHLFEHMMFQGSQNLGRWSSSSWCSRTAAS